MLSCSWTSHTVLKAMSILAGHVADPHQYQEKATFYALKMKSENPLQQGQLSQGILKCVRK